MEQFFRILLIAISVFGITEFLTIISKPTVHQNELETEGQSGDQVFLVGWKWIRFVIELVLLELILHPPYINEVLQQQNVAGQPVGQMPAVQTLNSLLDYLLVVPGATMIYLIRLAARRLAR